MRNRAWLAVALVAVGCTSSQSGGADRVDPDGSVSVDGGSVTDPDARPNNPPPPELGCQAGFNVCVGWNRVAECDDTGPTLAWDERDCGAGEGCVAGACVPDQCADECHLGQSDCSEYDAADDAYRSPSSGKTHDRARLFEKWIRTDSESLYRDQIVSARYTSAARNAVDSIYIGDSAMHTGIYLAAEAHRLDQTGSWQARKNVRSLVDVFHRLFNVSGDPGMLATSIFPAGDSKVRQWTNWSCSDFDRHCDVEYDGARWDYVGEPSRDMYMGPLLGLVAAYDALGPYDEVHRARIREDLVVWARELIRKRSLPVRLVLNGGELPVQMLEARFFIPESADLVDGAVEVHFSTSDLSGGSIRGGQEFMPNPAVLFRQFSVLSWIPDTPRSSSGLMVPAILRAAMHVIRGNPAYAADYDQFRDFFYNNGDQWGNVDSWIDIASNYLADEGSDCDSHYFGVHLAWIAGYTFALLEDDPATRTRLMNEVITPKLWGGVDDHGNSFFTFAYGAVNPSLAGAPLQEAIDVIDDFPAPPRVRKPTDSRNKYGNKSCADEAVAIRDRPVVFLHWHSNPWSTVDSGDTRQTYPGHDYLLGYWMGRAYGFVSDDTPNRCLRRR